MKQQIKKTLRIDSARARLATSQETVLNPSQRKPAPFHPPHPGLFFQRDATQMLNSVFARSDQEIHTYSTLLAWYAGGAVTDAFESEDAPARAPSSRRLSIVPISLIMRLANGGCVSDILDRVVIIGASGQLGTDLVSEFADLKPIAVEHKFLDVQSDEAVRGMFARYKPTLVLNTSAFHQVDLCELDPVKAFSINTHAVDRLAAMCALTGATFAHVSTDYVFDGSSSKPYDEADPTFPVNVYGISKVAGELSIRRYESPHFIFRVSGLFGRAGTSNKGVTFIERMLRMAETRQPIKVVDDIVFSPSYTVDVASAIRKILVTEKFGTYHVTNRGQCSWYDFAVAAIAARGLDWSVERSKSDPKGGYARRPSFSVLGHGSIVRNGLADLRSWESAVADFVAARAERAALAS